MVVMVPMLTFHLFGTDSAFVKQNRVLRTQLGASGSILLCLCELAKLTLSHSSHEHEGKIVLITSNTINIYR